MKLVDCNVIKDLLPSYIDKISSKETNKLVEQHLQSCKNCCMTLEEMKKDTNAEVIEGQEEQIDYLKGYRKNKIKTIIFSILITVIVFECFILSSCGITIASVVDIVDHYSTLIDVNKLEVKYMYISEVDDRKMLNVYLSSDKYKNLNITECQRVDEYEVIESGRKRIAINCMFQGYKIYENMEKQEGIECSFDITEESIEKIYIQDMKGNSREIWNKDMNVMTESEWKKS